ncbi:hypothetical protein AB1Y20_007438 [Prymnesium parvum]|uniref:Uncharacterized protein n=1 Tax=Prymnesium parvum TaxID=97485 RepID=A0AB34IYL5_PRYPA
MCEFASPGSLGALAAFRARFALPIGAARDAARRARRARRRGGTARRWRRSCARARRGWCCGGTTRCSAGSFRRARSSSCAPRSPPRSGRRTPRPCSRGRGGGERQAVLALRGVCSAGAASAAEDEEGCVLKEKGAEAAADVGKGQMIAHPCLVKHSASPFFFPKGKQRKGVKRARGRPGADDSSGCEACDEM